MDTEYNSGYRISRVEQEIRGRTGETGNTEYNKRYRKYRVEQELQVRTVNTGDTRWNMRYRRNRRYRVEQEILKIQEIQVITVEQET